MSMKIYLTNLGKYNEGILDGVWLDLPATDKEFAAAFDEIEVSHDDTHYYSDGEGHAAGNGLYGEYEEFFITDYECDFMNIGEYESIEKLNDIAFMLEDLQDYQMPILEALIADGYDITAALDNIDNCYFLPDVNSAYDLGEYCAREYGDLDRIPDDLVDFFDFEAYGNYLETAGNYVYVDGGCVEICA